MAVAKQDSGSKKNTNTTKEQNKQAIQNINRTGTVSGKSSGVKGSSNVVRTNTDTSNLAGNNRQQALGTPKMTSPSKVNVMGKASTQEKGKTYVPSDNYSTSKVNTRSAKTTLQNNSYNAQTSLSGMADESNKKAQGVLNAIGNAFNKAVKDPLVKLYQNNVSNTEDRRRAVYDRVAEAKENKRVTADKNRAETRKNTTQEDYNAMFDEGGNVRDFQSEINSRKNRANELANVIATSENGMDVSFAQTELQKVQDEIKYWEDLEDKYYALEEDYNLGELQKKGDTETYNSYRDMISHRKDNIAQRAVTAGEHLASSFANEVPSLIDQTIYLADRASLDNALADIETNRPNMSNDDYVNALATVNEEIQTALDNYNAGLSRSIQTAVDQYSANTYYGATDVEKFVLQAGESTAQFLMHFIISKGMAQAFSSTTALEEAGRNAIAEGVTNGFIGSADDMAVAVENEIASYKSMVEATGKSFSEELVRLGENQLGGDISTYLMSFAGVQEKTNEMIQMGLPADQIALNAGMSYLLSYEIEKIGMDRFVDMLGTPASVDAYGRVLNTFKGGLSEGLEEVAEGLIEPLIDAVTLGKDYEVNGNEVLMAFLLGGTSGLVVSGSANIASGISAIPTVGKMVINNRVQRNMVLNQIALLEKHIDTMTPHQLDVYNEVVGNSMQSVNEYDSKSQTLGVELSTDEVAETSYDENQHNVIEAFTQDFNEEVQNTNRLEVIQAENEKKILNVVNEENTLIEATQNILNQNGYDIDARVFNSLSEKERNNALVALDFSKVLGVKTNITNKDGIRQAILDNGFSGTRAELERLVNGSKGVVTSNGEIFVNANAQRPILYTLTHELTHGTESSKYYPALRDLVKKTLGDKWDSALAERTEAYKNIKNADPEKELVARTVEEFLGDEKFIDDLIKYNYSLASKIWQDLKALASNDETDKIRNTFEKAFADSLEKDADTNRNFSYSLRFKDIIQRVAPNAINPETGKFRSVLSQLKNLRNDPRATGNVVVPLGESLMFAGVSNALFIDKSDLTHIEKADHNIDDATLAHLLHHLDDYVVLGLDYTDRRTTAYKKDIILDDGGKRYIMGLYKSKDGYNLNKVNTMYEYGDDPDHSIGLFILRNLGENHYYYANEKSSDFLKRLGINSQDAVRKSTALDYRVAGERRGVKFSLAESEIDKKYMDAVNSGNMEEAQRMVDETAKANGYDIKAYHSTNAEFTKFDKEKQGTNFNNYLHFGSGFYFGPTAEETKKYGKKTMSVYLSADRLLDVGKPVENGKAYQYLIDNGYHPADAKFAMNYGDRFINALYDTLLDRYSQGGANVQVQNLLREFGYDGIDAVYGVNNDKGQVVVFEPSQIKSADPVVYDDNGNVIPLSERFNTENDDIRYSFDGEEDAKQYYATIAPYLDTRLNENNRQELIDKAEKAYDGVAKEIAKSLGISPAPKTENIGGFENNEGQKLRELSWTFDLGEIDSTKARLFTSLMGDLAFENQEAVICMRYLDENEGDHKVGEKGEDGGTYGKEYGFQFKDLKTVEESLLKADIANYNIDRESNYLKVQDFGFDPNFDQKLDILLEGNNYESAEERPIYSYYLSRESRQSLYETQLKTKEGVREGNESDLSGRQVEEANRRVSDVINNGQNSPFLRRAEAQGNERSDLEFTEKDLKNYNVIQPATKRKYSEDKNIDRETGVLSPKFITELDATVGRTTRKAEIDDAENYAEMVATQLDNGADPEDVLNQIKEEPLNNGVIRALTIGQVLADRGLYDEMHELAQWARDTDRLAGQLIESNKHLYQLDNEMSRSIYLTKVEQNLIDEYNAKFKRKSDIDIEETVHKIFSDAFEATVKSKTVREFRNAVGALARQVNKAMPKTVWDRIRQYRMISMLSGPKTAVSNFVSNVATHGLYRMNNFNQAILEMAMKEVTVKNVDDTRKFTISDDQRNTTLRKNREVSKRNKRYADKIWEQIDKGAKSKYGDDVEKIPDIIKNSKAYKTKTQYNTVGFKAKNLAGKALDLVQSVQAYMLDDSPIAKLAFRDRFNDICQARNIDVRTLDPNSKQFASVVDSAFDYAEEVVSHNATAISKTLANIQKYSSTNVRVDKDSLTKGVDEAIKLIKERANKGESMYVLLDGTLRKMEDWFVPFYKTNASLMQKAFQFSPLEWAQVKNDYDKVKAGRMDLVDMVDHMSKAVTGTTLYMLGAIFAYLGWLKWDKDDEDYSGRLAIKIPGTNIGYTADFLDPISTIFAKGVVLAQELMENGVSFTTLQKLAGDYGDIFLNDEMDMFSSMKDFFDTVGKVQKGEDDYGEYTIADGATDTAFTILNSYIPALMRDISRVIDPAKKSTYDNSNMKYLFNRLLNSTPFRTKLADKKDATGRTINYTQPFTGNDVFDRILTQMVSKGKLVDMEGKAVTTRSDNGNLGEKADEMSQMAQDFQFNDANGDGYSDTHWIRDTVPANIYPGGEQVQLGSEERDEYGKTWTDVWTSGAKFLLNNSVYKGLDYEKQADVVYELQGIARECIEADYCLEHNIEPTKAQKTALAIRNFCTTNGKIDGNKLGLIALGTAKENKLANGGQRYVLGKRDENGKTITNSRQLYMRQLYEQAGIYDEIVKAVAENDNLSYQDFGLGKTVVEKYSADTAKSKYAEIYGAVMAKANSDSSNKKTSSSGAKKSSRKNSKKSSNISGGSSGIRKAGKLNKLAPVTSKSLIKTDNKIANNFTKAYASVFNRSGKKPSAGGSSRSVACPRCGASVSANADKCPVCGANL